MSQCCIPHKLVTDDQFIPPLNPGPLPVTHSHITTTYLTQPQLTQLVLALSHPTSCPRVAPGIWLPEWIFHHSEVPDREPLLTALELRNSWRATLRSCSDLECRATHPFWWR